MWAQYYLKLNENLTISKFLIKVYRDLNQTMIEVNIWNAF
jgi:hypothetical protein